MAATTSKWSLCSKIFHSTSASSVHDLTISYTTSVRPPLFQQPSHTPCLKPSRSRCLYVVRQSSAVTSALSVVHILSSLCVVWRRGELKSSLLNCTKVIEGLDSVFLTIRSDIYLSLLFHLTYLLPDLSACIGSFPFLFIRFCFQQNFFLFFFVLYVATVRLDLYQLKPFLLFLSFFGI